MIIRDVLISNFIGILITDISKSISADTDIPCLFCSTNILYIIFVLIISNRKINKI